MTIAQVAEVERVFAEASVFLQHIVDAADELVVALPDKQYVTAGEAVHDCEQVVVTMTEVTSGLPGLPVQIIENCPLTWTMAAIVDIARCGPKPTSTGTISADKLTEAARVHSADAAVLMNAANRRLTEKFGGVGASIVFVIPEGGFIVTRMLVQVSVN